MQQLFQPALCKKSYAQLSPYIWFLVKLVDLTFNPLAQYFLSASSKISILVHLGKWKKVLLKEWVVHRDFLPETTVQRRGEGRRSLHEEIWQTLSATWSRSTSTVKTLDRMKWKWYFTSVVFLLKIPNYSLILRKTSDKFHYKCILLTIWPMLLKMVKVIKKKNGGEGEEFE